MLFISAGLQKSGTAWYFRMTNDILVRTGRQDAQDICRQYRLTPAGSKTNCNIGVLSARQLARCLRPSLLGRSFLVKTHEAPTRSFRILLRLGQVQATYIFRDPRDVALSVFERGEQARARAEADPFARFQTLEEAIDFVAGRLPIWKAWTACPRVFVIRYEALLADPAGVLAELCRFWSVEVPAGVIADVVATYDAGRIADQPIAKGLHLNVAQVGRFRAEMSAAQLARCSAAFGSYVQRMGYKP